MKKAIVFWVEEYFYNPRALQKILSYLLAPLSFLYCFVVYLKYKVAKPKDFGIPIVSIGNLNVGGSGKTPLLTSLAKHYDGCAIVLRGYGRKTHGMLVVKDGAKILCDVDASGDEAMIYAHKVPHAMVIVSEDRAKGIAKAKELGAKIVFLDDGYSKHGIKKLDLLIQTKSKNNFCLPAGPFRERLWHGKNAIVLKEEKDFTRVVELKNKSDKMSLVTAIARPSRLDKYLPEVVAKHYFEDHHSFTKEELDAILKQDETQTLLVTYKDFVKIEHFGLRVSLLDLDVEVQENIFTIIDTYRGK